LIPILSDIQNIMWQRYKILKNGNYHVKTQSLIMISVFLKVLFCAVK